MKRDALNNAVQQQLKRLPPPYEAHYGVVPLAPPEDAIDLRPVMAEHNAAVAALARADALARELADPYLISRILPRREAVSSSSIEGTNSTLDELLSVEEGAQVEVTEATAQVRDYALALDHLIPRAAIEGPAIFTPDLVSDLHRAVMKGDSHYRDRPGQLRHSVVWIGGADIAYSSYNPPPPEDIPSALNDTISYMRGEGMQGVSQSSIVRMAVAHSHFEAVHPFRDGNGRVGRLLLPLMMAAEKQNPLYLSPYIEAHKGRYYGALKAAQQRLEWHKIVGFIAEAIVGTLDELLATRAALSVLHDLWQSRRKFRERSAARKALELLPQYPIITTKRLSELLNVSIPAASEAIAKLVEARILRERTGYSRNRIFGAPEVLLIMNRPFGEMPLLPDA